MIKITTKPNTNGNSKQLIIDNGKKEIKCGYYLFAWGADITATPSQLKSIVNAFINDGYKIIK